MFKIIRTLRTLCFACLASVFTVPVSAQNIITVAGGGPNNVPALSAGIYSPSAVAFDPSGTYYFSTLNRVFRVDNSGQLTVYAGNGALGFNGDGIAATSAELCDPHGIAFDSAGNLFIADECNDRVRRVDATTRIITTVAGNGTAGYSGDGGPATSAALFEPSGVAVDSRGNLFIADSINRRVRRVDAPTQVITTVAGNGIYGFAGDGGPAASAELTSPSGIATDASGNLFIADLENERIRRVDAATQIISTVAGNGFSDGCCSGGFSGDGGPATSAEINVPNDVVVDGAGNLLIADTFNHRIRRVDAATQVITTIAGNGVPSFSGDGGQAASAALNAPSAIALDSAGNLFIADTFNFRIRRVNSSNQVITTAAGNGTYSFSGDGGPAAASQLNNPSGVAVDGARNVFIADAGNNRVRRVSAATQVITTVAGGGTGGDGGPAISAALFAPESVATDSAGNLFIGSGYRVRRVDAATGIITTVAGNGTLGSCSGPATSSPLSNTTGVAVDGGGNLFISGNPVDLPYNELCRVDAATGMIGTYPSSGFGNNAPVGVAVDRAGNLFFAADEGGFYVDYGAVFRVEAATQTVTRIAGGGFCGVDCSFSGDGGPATSAVLDDVSGVAVDGAGNVFITNGRNRIRRVDAATQVITTVAGGGTGGDGGPATSAGLSAVGVAVDSGGNLFIADNANNRIREVVASKQATSVAVSSSADPSILGQAVTLTATIYPASGSAVPTGTVTFQDGTTTLGTASLSSSGSATFTASSLAVASHPITANYSGDSGFFASNGSLTENVSYAISPLYDQTRSVPSGAVFPIKLYLSDASGNDVSSTAVPLHATRITSLSGYSGSMTSPGSANPSGNFRFEATLGPAGGYILNLNTARLAPGKYSVQFTAGSDPLPHALNFAVR